jgi:xanthine dehydrogenase accessory factor
MRQWFENGRPFGLATVVGTSGSAPRGVGAVLAVDPDGKVLGSVSGGCVEGAVYEAAAAAALDGGTDRLRFGVADDDPFAVGLTCGGEIDVVVETVDGATRPHFGMMLSRLIANAAVAEVVAVGGGSSPGHLVVSPDETLGSLGSASLDDLATVVARDMLGAGISGLRECSVDGVTIEVFVRAFAAPPRMIVFGALDVADALAQAASFVGYRVVVCDARPIFTTAERFPHADEVVVEWPHQYLTQQWHAGLVDVTTVLCVLTHDPKFDAPLLDVALRTPAGYIGVMGSRATHDDRLRRLTQLGLDDTHLRKLSSPIGLDIGGRTPQETAMSIVAEVIAVANDRPGGRLRETDGAIHAAPSRHRLR